jgi:hypothetical protein
MGKLASLEELERRGLNTPLLLLELKQFEENKLDKWKAFYSEAQGKVSIRTERDGEKLCPFRPNISLHRAAAEMPDFIKKGYRILVFRGIDPNDSLFCGNFAHTGKKFIVEWIKGPGTVRELESSSRLNHVSVDTDKTLGKVIHPAQTLLDVLRFTVKENELFEWSIYSKEVGKHPDHLIFWEIRSWR